MSLITFWVTSDSTHSERRFSPLLSIADLKSKLEIITGTPAQHQSLSLLKGSSGSALQLVARLDDEARTLDEYGATEWMTIKVDNLDPSSQGLSGQFTDLSRVEKFELTNEEYEARSDTVLAYKQRNKLGRFAPSSETPATPFDPALVPGARCEVSLSDEGMKRRGEVKFVGEVEFGKKEVWVGVMWDEPVGKGDGLVEGKRYFQTPPFRASFVKPENVRVGDYPELDPFADEEDEEM
ncbi:hypothetical protein MNV49_002071 [Pseudohyphozyma bogoriensis]|nr:hypothetical protein MNV49_002071 [Pseudohyphozyma bogoriensis]